MGRLLTRIMRGTLSQVRHVTPVPAAAADGLVAEVYAQVERDFGMLAPPISLHSPAPGPLAAAWLILRETMLVSGRVTREVKEAVAVAISQVNACPYGVDVHSAALHGLGRDQAAAALADNRTVAGGLHPIVSWAMASGLRRRAAAVAPPVPAEQLPELIGTVVTFHYLNRMVNLFLIRSPIPIGLPRVAHETARRVAGRLLRGTLRIEVAPGAARELLGAAALPADLSWAAGNPAVADAFARAAAAIDAAGRRSVPASVRELVAAKLAGWDGEPPGVLRDWAYDAVGRLPRGDRPAGVLALLAAFSSSQVGPTTVEGFRRHYRPDDESLIEVACWASMAAARTHGRWLWRAEDRNVEDVRRRRPA